MAAKNMNGWFIIFVRNYYFVRYPSFYEEAQTNSGGRANVNSSSSSFSNLVIDIGKYWMVDTRGGG